MSKREKNDARKLRAVGAALRDWGRKAGPPGRDSSTVPDEEREAARQALGLAVKNLDIITQARDRYGCAEGVVGVEVFERLGAAASAHDRGGDLGRHWVWVDFLTRKHLPGEVSFPDELDRWASRLEQEPAEGGEAEDLQPTLGGKSLQDVSATQEAKEYDAFLCHASEDKDAIVRPFAEAMEQQGLKPWFDKAEVRWGDSLVNKINHGLSRSKLVVVFVSPDFLGKKAWSEKEFNAAMSMEVDGKTVVLPLLCGVTRDQIQQRYPVISDKVYRELPQYIATSKTEPSRLESLVLELRQRIAERG